MPVSKITPVLLAGGSGTRLWPVSRDGMPKQFIPLAGEFSTYQQTLERVKQSELFAAPIVVTANDFRFFARHQAEELGLEPDIILEPERRDSGPAIAAGALLALKRDPEAMVLALAADHVILDQDLFQEACEAGREAADGGWLVTFGVRPTEPRTSYGYIRPGPPLDNNSVRAVESFVEKPDAATAARYVAEGYLWNSGNLLFRADSFLSELGRHEPAMLEAAERAVARAEIDLGFLRLDPAAFSKAPKKSIDYAVMEKTDHAAVVEARFRWSDIGSWDALFEIGATDKAGNILHGPAFAIDSENCLVHAEQHLTAVVGVKDLVVVTTPDAVLVLPRGRAQEVKGLVGALKSAGRPEASNHRRHHRPWGSFESVDLGERFQVKRLIVRPGAALSLQKHMHRAEHWVVVRGTAVVTIDGTERLVHENESTYIPLGAVHRLANPGKIALELIEVQTGSYLGEDDIVRFEDVYGRGSTDALPMNAPGDGREQKVDRLDDSRQGDRRQKQTLMVKRGSKPIGAPRGPEGRRQ
jgi:mannose-1-phosphate guanylyltransferase/mannose-6-phosphate isomerase